MSWSYAELKRRIQRVGGAVLRGLLCFSPAEAMFLAAEGFDDLLKRGDEIVGRARTYRGLGRCFY